ncbi:hypothetical protein JW777_10360, partial [bacterium]|nr:hypothetical protein [bacterium]
MPVRFAIGSSATRWSRSGVLFAVGFFALFVQALLFRSFLSVFEGNELAIAGFFSSWLFWTGVGALAARISQKSLPILRRRFTLFVLLYVPACLLQDTLIGASREIAGVRSYELFPLLKMLPYAFVLNAPVSFCTGLFFTIACGWAEETVATPVARVYILESLGGAAGGVVVTLLLSFGMAEESAFLCAAILLSLAAGLDFWMEKRNPLLLLLPVAFVGLVLSGGAARWERMAERRAWSRLIPAESYRGSFATPQGRYLYGDYRGQFTVVTRESITDTIPSVEYASQVAAIHLAQRPDSRRFLVAGPQAFSICRRLLTLPQAETVVWLDTDPRYAARLLEVLPKDLAGDLRRIRIP